MRRLEIRTPDCLLQVEQIGRDRAVPEARVLIEDMLLPR
jgi:hypothetical protein